jgi:hypothetical protein
MSPGVSPWVAAGVATVLSVAFAWFMRLPLPFDGFSAVAAAMLAAFGTLALAAWMPVHWVWSDADRLSHAFQARHGISDTSARIALQTITTAHTRAGTLREAGSAMRKEMAIKVEAVADRLDTAAREIFYTPDRQRDLRAVLVRSELIEDAATAHARLRERELGGPTEDASREKLTAALDALEAAFDQTELLAARGLLQEVEVASDVAERLLAPRSSLKQNTLS